MNFLGICKKYSTKTDQTDQTTQGITILGITLQPSTRLYVAKCAVSHQLTSTLDYMLTQLCCQVHRQLTCSVCVIYGFPPRFSQYKHVIDLCKPRIYHHLLFWKHWQIFPIITTYPMKKKLVNVLSPEMVYQLPLLLGISIEVSFRLVKLPLTTKKERQVRRQKIVWAKRRAC